MQSITDTIASLPTLGSGIGFREPFLGDLFLNQSQVDFLEVTADHYIDTSSQKMRELDLLSDHFSIIPHGINLSLAGAEGLDNAYVGKLAALVNRLKPAWWSEHIAFTHAGGVEIGHLTPPPFTHEALDVLCRNIEQVKRLINSPLILENISYVVELPGAEMTEAQFLTDVLERTDCGLLLDVTNLHLNAINNGYDAVGFLNEIPLERVVQLHFVGGRWSGDVYVDTHSEPTPPEIWDLLDTVIKRAPVKGILLERDENIPPFAELAEEMAHAREIGRRHGRWV